MRLVFNDDDIPSLVDSLFLDGTKVNLESIVVQDIQSDPHRTICYDLTVFLRPTASILGDTLRPILTVETIVEESSIDDNVDSLNIEIVGSFDPNDKNPDLTFVDYESYINNSLPTIEYLIRFQNEGTFPAEIVRLTDSIDGSLDISSFRMISSSHSFELRIEEDIVTWVFEDINLVPKETNEEESIGYVLFAIETLPGLGIMDSFTNVANIFFDFNEPIITNVASTRFSQIDSAFQLQTTFINASTDLSTVLGDSLPNLEQTYQLIIKDINGSVVFENTTETNLDDIDLSSLDNGLYFVYVLLGDNHIVGGYRIFIDP